MNEQGKQFSREPDGGVMLTSCHAPWGIRVPMAVGIAMILVCCHGAEVLHIYPGNPRYFADGSGKAIYLAGHQSFVDLQDNSFNKEFTWRRRRKLDWGGYLDFLAAHHFNYVRNWVIWSTGSGVMAPKNQAIAAPMPYRRVEGHGTALDGLNKFDLEQFDESFFRRMRRRCDDLQKRGIYVSIMLFEVYGFLKGEPEGEPPQTLWDGNVFNRANNINDIHADEDGDGQGMEFFYTRDTRILALQRAYVSKVIDTLNSLDNNFYEIANELYAPAWQTAMIRFIQDYEQGKPKQHLILMSPGGRTRTGRWRQMPRNVLLSSPADCFAVAGGWNHQAYRQKNPPPNQTGKPGILDMDHVKAGSSDLGYVWTAFTRGYHFNLYDKPFESPSSEGPEWERIRKNVGQTIVYAERMDLTQASPRTDLASTGFCLARPGKEYVVYQPEGRNFEVRELNAGDRYHVEWYDTEQCRVTEQMELRCKDPLRTFTPPGARMVLFLQILSNAGGIR